MAQLTALSFLLFVSYVSICCASVRVHSDGSISSNIGPTTILQRLIRASYMSESKSFARSRELSGQEISKMVDEHNKYRLKASATNMQMVTWDDDLASSARKHAEHCTLDHSVKRANFGENIWISQYADFSLAVRLWYEEVNDAKCACKDKFKECCGHYTQVMWAETNKVGCGFAECKTIANAPNHHYSLVCHYSPAGNLVMLDGNGFIGLEAFKQSNPSNPVCSQCPDGSTCSNGLCVIH